MRLQTAIMWFDNSPSVPFDEKVNEAAAAYRDKFGRSPNVCYVNPGDLPNDLTPRLGLVVEPEPSVLRHHIYVGVSGAPR